jgi:tricorn protease-like protein
MTRLLAGLLAAVLLPLSILHAQGQPAKLLPAAAGANADAALPPGAVARLGVPQAGTWAALYSVAFSPDGKLLASGSSDRTVRLWDVATGKEVRQFGKLTGQVFSVTFAPDGKGLAAAAVNDLIWVWEPSTGKQIVEIASALGRSNLLKSVAYSPDGSLLAMAGGNSMIRLREASTGNEVRSFGGPGGTINSITFSPDGKTLATVSHDRRIRLWEVATGKELHSIPEFGNIANCVRFSPDGKFLATGGTDGQTRLWDMAREECKFQIPAHVEGVSSLAFSPDCRTLATGGADQVVRLWEVATGKERLALRGSRGLIHSVAFSPDGRMLASGNHGDATVLLWDITGLRGQARGAAGPLPAREIETLWTGLGSNDAGKAYRAVWALAAANKQAVALLGERLRPQPKADQAQIDRLLGDLDSERFAVRDKAMQQLEKLGIQAQPALQRVLKGEPSLEVRRRVEELLDKLSGWVRAADVLQLVRGVEVLEKIGSPEAKDTLHRLAKQTEDTTLAENAREAIKRLTRPEPPPGATP